jgi:transcription factor S
MFCPKCGAILLPKSDKGKRSLECSCGYKDSKPGPIGLKEVIKDNKEIVAIEEDADDKAKPITDDVECPRCRNRQAYYWLIQTRASDEPATKFLKCTNCKHTWRDYN